MRCHVRPPSLVPNSGVSSLDVCAVNQASALDHAESSKGRSVRGTASRCQWSPASRVLNRNGLDAATPETHQTSAAGALIAGHLTVPPTSRVELRLHRRPWSWVV